MRRDRAGTPIKSLAALAEAAQNRASVIGAEWPPGSRPLPAAVIMHWQGDMIHSVLEKGLSVYKPKPRIEHGAWFGTKEKHSTGPLGARIETLAALAEAAKNGASVIAGEWENPLPASMLMPWQARAIHGLLEDGLFIYRPKKEIENGDAETER